MTLFPSTRCYHMLTDSTLCLTKTVMYVNSSLTSEWSQHNKIPRAVNIIQIFIIKVGSLDIHTSIS